jgi:predicted MFS family arabinose efflux permease
VQGRATGVASTLTVACLLGGSAGWAMTAAGAGAATLVPAYDVGLVTVGLMTTALATPYALLQLPSGVLVDRIGVRNASVLGLLVVVLAHVAACLTPVTWLALVARTLSGAGFAVCFVSGAELARRSGAGPSGIGFFGGVALGSSGVAVLVVPLAEPLLGWRSAWATTGLVAVVALLCVALVALPDRGPEAARPDESGTGRALLADQELHRLGSVHAVTLGIGVVLSNWAALVLVETWGFGRTAAAAVASLVLGCSVLSRPLGGVVARRFPRRVAAVALLSLPVCAAATLALAVPTTPAVAVVAVLAVGVFSGLPFATVISAVQARRPDRPAAAVGMVNSQANTLILVGTPLVGAAIAAGHTTAALVAVAALWTVPLATWPQTMGRRSARGGRVASAPVEVVAD